MQLLLRPGLSWRRRSDESAQEGHTFQNLSDIYCHELVESCCSVTKIMIRKHFKMINGEVIADIRSGACVRWRQRSRWDLSSLRRCWNIRTFYASCWDHKNWYTFFSQHDVFDGKIKVAVSCSHGFERLCISLFDNPTAVWNPFHILDWGFICIQSL